MIKKIQDTAVSLWKDERAASLLEYTVLIGLITAGVVATVITVGDWVGTRWLALKTGLGI